MIKKNSRILIIRLSAIGDVIETLPAIHALRTVYPEAYLGWVLEKGPYSLLQGHPDINELILFPKLEIRNAFQKGNFTEARKIIKEFASELQGKNFDLAIDFQNLFKSGMVALFSGAKVRIGYNLLREGSRYFLTKTYPAPKETMHFVEWQLELVRLLGADVSEVKFVLPHYSREEKVIEEFLRKNSITDSFFCLAPGTSWPNKCWTTEGMAALVDRLQSYGKVVIIGSELDRKTAEATIKISATNPLNTIGRFNLRELAVLLRRSSLFFGGDTGPMHLAVAVGTQVIIWLGPTSRGLTGPYQKNAVTVSLNLPCQPCYKRKCNKNKCMKDLTFEKVWAATKPLLFPVKKA